MIIGTWYKKPRRSPPGGAFLRAFQIWGGGSSAGRNIDRSQHSDNRSRDHISERAAVCQLGAQRGGAGRDDGAKGKARDCQKNPTHVIELTP
jgi:hypothetical protein